MMEWVQPSGTVETETATPVEVKDVPCDLKFSSTVMLQMPKFSKGYSDEFFDEFIGVHVGDDFVSLGRLSFPNEFQLVVKTNEARETLLRIRRLKVRGRTCWIKPLLKSEIRGFIHWLPLEIPNTMLIPYLQEYGEVIYIRSEKEMSTTPKTHGDARCFSLFLKQGTTVNCLPHFLKIGDFKALLTIRGREPMCFHCKDVGHRKSECNKHQVKLDEMCKGPPNPAEKKKPREKRGTRHVVKEEEKQIIAPVIQKTKTWIVGTNTEISTNLKPVAVNAAIGKAIRTAAHNSINEAAASGQASTSDKKNVTFGKQNVPDNSQQTKKGKSAQKTPEVKPAASSVIAKNAAPAAVKKETPNQGSQISADQAMLIADTVKSITETMNQQFASMKLSLESQANIFANMIDSANQPAVAAPAAVTTSSRVPAVAPKGVQAVQPVPEESAAVEGENPQATKKNKKKKKKKKSSQAQAL